MNDYTTALMASLRLNDGQFITDCLESTSVTQSMSFFGIPAKKKLCSPARRQGIAASLRRTPFEMDVRRKCDVVDETCSFLSGRLELVGWLGWLVAILENSPAA